MKRNEDQMDLAVPVNKIYSKDKLGMSNINYLRFTIQNNKGDPFITNLTDIFFITNDNRYISLNRLINPSFTTSTPEPNPSYPIENLFDGSLSYTQWNTASTIVITTQFNTPWSISEYPVYALYINNGVIYSSYAINTDPNSFIVELSSDNINWTNYSTITNAVYTGNTDGNGGFTNFPFISLCVGPDTKVLLEDSVYKKVSELQRGDRVVQDVKTGAVKPISRVIVSSSDNCITIPKGLLGNTENVLITQNHPIWVNADKNRICGKHVSGVEKAEGRYEVYSIQFDEEGTFYVDGLKVDSISPNYHTFKLPKEQFIDRKKYIKGCMVRQEDDPRRGKPPMIKEYLN